MEQVEFFVIGQIVIDIFKNFEIVSDCISTYDLVFRIIGLIFDRFDFTSELLGLNYSTDRAP